MFGSEVSGLGRVSDQGGTPETISSLDSRQEEVAHLWPQFLPGDKLLFTIETAGGADEHQVAVHAENGKHQTLITGASNACFVPPNYIVYYQTGSLLATAYDATSSEVAGPAISIVDDVMQSLLGAGHFGLSGQGWLVYVPGGAQERMVLVDHHGNEHGFSDKRRPFVHPRFSPDGLKALVGIAGSDDDIWVYEFTRDTLTQLAFEAENHWPIWTADGKGVTFTRHAGDRPNLHSMPVDQSTAEKRLTTGDHIKMPHHGLRTGECWPFSNSIRQRDGTSGCRWTLAAENHARFCERFLMKPAGRSRPTVAGWLSCRTSLARMKYTSSHSAARVGDEKFPSAVAPNPSGPRAGEGSFSVRENPC